MKYLTFGSPKNSYKICLLVPVIKKDEILKYYIEPYGLNPEDILVIDLYQEPNKKKSKVSVLRDYYYNQILPELKHFNVEYVIIANSDYFKAITKEIKSDRMIGYVIPNDSFNFIYVPDFRAIFYDPENITNKIKLGIESLIDHMAGCYIDPGKNIIKSCFYPKDVMGIKTWLDLLMTMDVDLSCDIETFSLKHYSAGLGSITFCWDQHNGVAFPIDLLEIPKDSSIVRQLLKDFFKKFKRKIIYHNISFDGSVLIYQLFMNDILDTEGLLEGLDVILKNWDDTKIISYLATNSCAGNRLSLKDQAQEYSGNYAVDDIKDITKIPLDELLEYNLIDGLSTWFVYNKNYPIMVKDQQLDVYNNIFKPAVKDIIQMQLTGLPVNMNTVKKVKEELTKDSDDAVHIMQSSPLVQEFVYNLKENWVIKRNSELKVKRVTIDDATKIVFNPNSPIQLCEFLYNKQQLPILAYTDKKEPSTSGDTLSNLINHTNNPELIKFLNALVDYKSVNKIITSFIPALENSQLGKDGWHYLFGNFNLGGTVSGRLSSNDPNLQNLPSSSKYAKAIKSCIEAPPGWIFCGVDFNSLEDRISALTTKDKNKLKVYTDGYDGHSLRAYSYFGENMPDIDENSVESINSIQKKYKDFRQDSKVPTFLLTYGGTYKGIIDKMGWSEEKSKMIEERYHILYKESDDWVQSKLDQASIDGYVTVAFGLRVRTPLLAQVIRGTSKTPFEAEGEGRTAGNALGQSWCLLNSRAASAFMQKVRSSEYRLDIKPCAQIHDANYLLIKDNISIVKYTNTYLIKEVQWQDHPDIWHDEVKLGGELSLFYPNWSKEINIPNNASEDEIITIVKNSLTKE